MAKHTQRPRIGIPADVRTLSDEPVHVVGEKYLAAVAHGAAATPLLLPGLGAGAEMASLEAIIAPEDLLAGLDGLFLTGSPSNLEPRHYGDTSAGIGPFDPQRDATTLPLLHAALARDMPILAVCRGLQELNVVCGGTLHAAVHEQPGFMDHREDQSLPRAQRYAPAHAVSLNADGFLARLLDTAEIRVNSLHGQGIARLGEGLVADAIAPDGLVEAAYLPGRRFVVGVQWHPEWSFRENPAARALFSAFGDAARAWRNAQAA
ncbi:MAG TPA: gamma-glutamyl-gamma-aminobutyrate hydrolase family protein [Salinisphaeraceae bacterium]|nr:gamma-glutamyl-gamma-aminobutyrate hydrolase family protein [Salinisphaeraceae bacterium]